MIYTPTNPAAMMEPKQVPRVGPRAFVLRVGEMADSTRSTSATDCRRFAAECLRLAGQSHDPINKATLISMATAWQRMAEIVDRAETVSRPQTVSTPGSPEPETVKPSPDAD